MDLWRSALERTSKAIAPFRLRHTGLTLTRSDVLAQLEPVDNASLLHFADEIADPDGLVDWVSAHRSIEPVEFMINSPALVRFRHRGRGVDQAMVPGTWCTVPLSG